MPAAGGALPHGGSLSSPQVMYFSSLFPYVVLACFLVRGLLLRGAVDGILHMFTPKVGVWVPTSPAACQPMQHNSRRTYCVRPWRDALGRAWALPSGSQGEGHRINLGEVRRSFREEVAHEAFGAERVSVSSRSSLQSKKPQEQDWSSAGRA